MEVFFALSPVEKLTFYFNFLIRSLCRRFFLFRTPEKPSDLNTEWLTKYSFGITHNYRVDPVVDTPFNYRTRIDSCHASVVKCLASLTEARCNYREAKINFHQHKSNIFSSWISSRHDSHHQPFFSLSFFFVCTTICIAIVLSITLKSSHVNEFSCFDCWCTVKRQQSIINIHSLRVCRVVCQHVNMKWKRDGAKADSLRRLTFCQHAWSSYLVRANEAKCEM